MIVGRTQDEKNARGTLWLPWFAWHPVRLVDTRYVWLRTVERRLKKVAYGIGHACHVDYRLPGSEDE